MLDHVNTIKTVLSPIGVTFAGLEYQTKIPVAAKYKGTTIIKKTRATVILTGGAETAKGLYARMVRKSAASIESNDTTSVENFESQQNWFDHDDTCYSIVNSRKNPENLYLYGFFNTANKPKSQYYINGKPVSKEEIRQYLTASKVKELFESTGIVENKTHGIKHKVIPRTIGIDNILSLRVRKTIFLK